MWAIIFFSFFCQDLRNGSRQMLIGVDFNIPGHYVTTLCNIIAVCTCWKAISSALVHFDGALLLPSRTSV